MRFSILDLLAATLLIALAAAVFAKREALTSTTAQLSALQTEISQAADECRYKQRQIASFERIPARRATDFDLLHRTVDRLADLSNQAALEATEPPSHGKDFTSTEVPTFSRDGRSSKRVIVDMPAGRVAKLYVEFFGEDGRPNFYEEFEKPSLHAVPLIPGVNFIEVSFDWNHVPNLFSVTNHTTGVSLFARATAARGGNWSPGGGQGTNGLEQLSPPYGWRVYGGGLGFKHGTQVLVHLTESKSK